MIDEFCKCYECGSALFRVIMVEGIKIKIHFHEEKCSKYNKDHDKHRVPSIRGYIKEKTR